MDMLLLSKRKMYYLQECINHAFSIEAGIQLSIKLQIKVETTNCI